MFIYPPTITIYNILRTSYFTAYYEDSTSKVRGYSRILSCIIKRRSILEVPFLNIRNELWTRGQLSFLPRNFYIGELGNKSR